MSEVEASSVTEKLDLVFRPNLNNIDPEGSDRALFVKRGDDFQWIFMHIAHVEPLRTRKRNPDLRLYQATGQLITGPEVACVFRFDDRRLTQNVTITTLPSSSAA